MAGPRNPAIESMPAWSGSTFVSVLNNAVPEYLSPKKATLPTPFVAVITGASRNIGREIAKAFAMAGATGLVLTARNAESLKDAEKQCFEVARNPSLKISSLSADVATEQAAILVAKTIRDDHNGHLDLLVNNAGILNVDATSFGKVGDINVANIEEPMKTNYFGRFYLIKHLLPALLATKSGAQTIVNISSIGSQVSGPLGYSLSALVNNRLSQRVVESYGEDGVMCYAVHPGAVMPEKEPEGITERLKSLSVTEKGLCGAWLIWLIQEKRSWLNGRYLDVTWDPTELEKKKDEIVKDDKLKMRLAI